MNKILFSILFTAFALTLPAQNPAPYEFKPVNELAATPVKSQDRTGTCWCFSTTSFLESEAIRRGKGELNLSEMFTVRNIYHQKCENYVRRFGHAQFGEGGLAHDNLNAVRQFGVVPESVYPGRKDPTQPLNHSALEQQLKTMCDTFIAQANREALQEDWLEAIDKALDAEFGPVPVKFEYNNTVFTPTSFRDYLGLNPDDYVSITSFTHHPFWSNFILEVPDNFSNGQFFNLPLNDLIRCLNYSLQQGYTVEWDADISNPGFSRNGGLAVVPQADWAGKTAEQVANTFKYWEPEKTVDQQYRQSMFDRLETQDDHLMHITGIRKESHGGIYYEVKNSWGERAGLNGYLNVSEPYMRLNTISFTVNKSALPPDIRKRMGLEPGDATVEKFPKIGRSDIKKDTPDPKATPVRDPRMQTVQPKQMKSVPLSKQSPSAPSSRE